MAQHVLHMIGNAHIDPVWLWQWQEGFHEVKATFRSALDRLNEYEDFVFVSSSAAFYAWVEQSDPGMFAEIQKFVSENRWQIVGGWWIQPDCNLPGGESFVRQGLYGQRYFKEKFGTTAVTGYNVDSFGHHGMLPQILKKSGLKYYTFLRPSPHEKGLPGRMFWWESDDGSRVLALRILFEYCTWGQDLGKHVRRCAGEIKNPVNELMCFYGVGNHGGGPTKENIESIRRLQDTTNLPDIRFSTPDQFFAQAEANTLSIPVVHDDLQHHASGCYSVHSNIKRWNRQAENKLAAAEKFAALAAQITGQPYPAAELTHAWKQVLFNQFHDILAGTSLEEAYEDARNQYGEAISIADRVLNLATQSIAWNINLSQDETTLPVILFNPHAWTSRINVEFQCRGVGDTCTVLDDTGHEIPSQLVQSAATAGGQKRVSFVAVLPPLGYRVYHLVKQQAPSLTTDDSLRADGCTLENQRFILEINPDTGCIKRLYDKQLECEVFQGEAAKPVVIDDPSDTWGHNVFRFDHVIGTFTPITIRVVEFGPVKATLCVMTEYGASKLMQEFTMYRDLDQIDVAVTVDWREQFKMLKLRFPLNLIHMRATYEIPYGHIERATNGDEEPGQSWLDVSGTVRDTGEAYGLSLLNDGKYSFDVNIRDIGLTVLRSPIYAHHMPVEPDPDTTYSFIDQGIQRFSYSLLPHGGSWEQAGTVKRAAELNQRPITLLGTYHVGNLPQRASYVEVDQDNIVVSVVKQAEDSDDLIIRCYETHKIATEAKICILNRIFLARFGPCEIKTFRIPHHTNQPIVETNLLEW